MNDLTNKETAMTLKHKPQSISFQLRQGNCEAFRMTNNRQLSQKTEPNKITDLNQVEDAAWHRSKSARFQQN